MLSLVEERVCCPVDPTALSGTERSEQVNTMSVSIALTRTVTITPNELTTYIVCCVYEKDLSDMRLVLVFQAVGGQCICVLCRMLD
jgi:hypothetical protein